MQAREVIQRNTSNPDGLARWTRYHGAGGPPSPLTFNAGETMADTKGHQFDPDSDSLSFPDGTVVGIMNDPEGANSAVEALLSSGVPDDGIQVMCCDSGARRLDPTGERHGLLGQLHRIIQLFGDQEVAHVKRQAAALEDGKFLISVPAGTDEEAEKVAGTLTANGGHFINWYTGMTVRRIGA